MTKKVSFNDNIKTIFVDKYIIPYEYSLSLLDKERFRQRILQFEEKYKLIYNKKFYNKMISSKNKEIKIIFSSIINMTRCKVCHINIKNFKIHERSNKHFRNTNQ